VLPRIWIVVLALALVAVQVHAGIELGDVTAEHADDELAVAVTVSIAPPPTRAASPRLEDAMPPAPARTRIFRPPRAAS
jgi:hypothetical protein